MSSRIKFGNHCNRVYLTFMKASIGITYLLIKCQLLLKSIVMCFPTFYQPNKTM